MPGVYILTGDNAPEKELFIKKLLDKALPGNARQNGLTVYHAAEAPAGEIVASLASSSLFSESSLVLIRGCEEMDSDSLKVLARYMRDPSAGNTLIMEGARVGSRITATHPFHQAVKESKGEVVEEVFSVPAPYKIAEWIIENASSRFKRRIDKDAAELLHEYVGDDLLGLLGEIEKMDIVLPEKAPIRAEEIRNYAGKMRAHKPWDLPHPVARKELAVSIEILHNLFDFNTAAVQILYGLGDHFIRLLRLKLYFNDKKSELDQAKRLSRMGFKGKDELNPLLADAANNSGYAGKPMRPNNVYNQMTLPRVLDQMENFSAEQFNYIIRLLATADSDLKTGQMADSAFSIEKLIFRIVLSDRFRAPVKF
jgi:DNA polymerase III delta subunit